MLLGLGSAYPMQSDKLSHRQAQQPVIVVGGDYNYPPFEFLNAKGEPEGFTIDLARAVGEEMGFQIIFELKSWPEVRNRLETGKMDAIMGMFYTPERDNKVDFTVQYFISSYSLFVRDGSDIKEFEDIRNKKVIVQLNDLGYDRG